MHENYMKRALELAKKGIGTVDPNPLVGAVIVKNDTIIAEGYHKKFGCSHAEVNAFNNTKEDVSGATMYVTLEPCSHYGKTPPCASKIVEKKLARVVIASLDPNPLVAGKGIEILKNAGIDVIVGVLDQENKQLNQVFFKYIQTKKPYVILKTAMTLDGKIASYKKQSKWISNETSRAIVHQMRERYMAIMVGVNTIIYDNPKLTCRTDNKDARHPIRIILDSHLRIQKDAYVLQTANTIKTIIFTTDLSNRAKVHDLEQTGVIIYKTRVSNGKVTFDDVMTTLGELGISSILLEGGSTLNFSALNAGVVDEVHAFIAPKILGGKDALTPVGGQGYAHIDQAVQLTLLEINEINGDVRLRYKVVKEG